MPNCYVWRTALFTAVGAFLAGYMVSSTSGILEMEGFQRTFNNIYISNNETSGSNSSSSNSSSSELSCSFSGGTNSNFITGFVASIEGVGAAVGSLFAGRLSDLISRKHGLAISGLLLGVGSSIVASSFHLWLLLAGRVLNGITLGILYVLMPVYIGEMSPKASRGMMVSLLGPAHGIGKVVGFCANIGFSKFELGWRLTKVLLGLGGLAYAFMMLWMQNSPRWLILKDRDEKAYLVLSKINYSSEVDTILELKDLKEVQKMSTPVNLVEFFKWKYISRLLIITPILAGVPIIGIFLTYHPVTFFCAVGIKPFIVSLIMGIATLFASIASVAFIDKIGRKIPLTVSTAVNVVLIVVVAFLLQIFGSDSDIINYIVAGITSIFAFIYIFAWAVIPWLLSSEIYPTRVKGIGNGILNMTFWISLFIYTSFTPFLLSPPFNTYTFLYMTAGANLLLCIYVFLVLPETKGVSLEHVDELFSQSWRKRIAFRSFIRRHESDAVQPPGEQELEAKF